VQPSGASGASEYHSPPNGEVSNFSQAVATFEQKLIQDALLKTGGNKRKAAQLLGVTERIFSYKLKHYGTA
jgi:DNA-binding NtrC family response regulator